MIKVKKGHVIIKGFNDELMLDFISLLDGFRELDNEVVAKSNLTTKIKEAILNVKFSLPDFKAMFGIERTVKKDKTKNYDQKI